MTTNATSKEDRRPYAPPSNVISVLHRLRSRNLPERIDPDYLRDAGIPEGTVARTLSGLRFLGLIDEKGNPNQALGSIHTSTDEEYRDILSGLIREAYSEVFAVIDPAEDNQERILNVFRRYTPASQRQRMVVFFLGMCREAGIPTLDVPRQRPMGGAGPAVRPATVRAGRAGADRSPARPKGGTPSDVEPALEGLIRSLPSPGTPLTQERRRQWLTMAEATLAFVYPEQGGESAAIEEDEGDDG